MNLRDTTGKILEALNGSKLTQDFDVNCNFSDTVNEIKLKAIKKGDKNFHVLVLETANLSNELFGDDSKGGEG